MITDEMLKNMKTGEIETVGAFRVLKVPGGWIYLNTGTGMVFVPYPAASKVEVDIDDDDLKKLRGDHENS